MCSEKTNNILALLKTDARRESIIPIENIVKLNEKQQRKFIKYIVRKREAAHANFSN